MRLAAIAVTTIAASIEIGYLAPAAGRDDRLGRHYVYASAGAFEAQDHCPGLLIDRDGLTSLREAAHFDSEKDDRAFLHAEYAKVRPGMDREIARGAAAWCKTAYGTFGPSGLHVLRRE